MKFAFQTTSTALIALASAALFMSAGVCSAATPAAAASSPAKSLKCKKSQEVGTITSIEGKNPQSGWMAYTFTTKGGHKAGGALPEAEFKAAGMDVVGAKFCVDKGES